MTNDKWIQFPKNPYEGQICYCPDTKDTFTYVIPKNYPDKGEWVMVTYQNFSKLN